jgi:hypothetical protein
MDQEIKIYENQMAKKLKYISHQRNILEETIKNCNIVIRVNIDIINMIAIIMIAIIEEKIKKEKNYTI